MRTTALMACLLLLVSTAAGAGEPDAEGCQDHPLLTRMPGYHIVRCETSAFDSVPFRLGPGQEKQVEGRRTSLLYGLDEGAREATRVAIQRNHAGALARIGGQELFDDDEGALYLRVASGGREVFVKVNAYITSQYGLDIVETGTMVQEVVASADALSGDLERTGRTVVRGILFDTGKATVRPESSPALKEVARLLAANPATKLYVVGHTDAVASLELNMRLSQERAAAVVEVLVREHGVAVSRLRPFGVGPLAPVAVNTTEEGRAANRRVELVRQ